MERSKGGERRAVREGDVLVGSTLIAVRGGAHWHRLAIVIRLRHHMLLLLFIAVHGWLLSIFLSCPAGVVELLSVVGDRWWCCVGWVYASPVVAGGGHVSFACGCVVCMWLCRFHVVMSFSRCHVVSPFLMSWLGGHGGCHHSSTAGMVSAGRFDTMSNWGNVVARRMWVVVGRCVEFVGSVIGVVVVG